MNLTLSVEDDLVEKARDVAASQGTSLQALVRKYIESLAGRPSGPELVKRMEANWRASDAWFKEHPPKKWKFSREEIYAERLDRMLKAKK
jgi:hypothetical protein